MGPLKRHFFHSLVAGVSAAQRLTWLWRGRYAGVNPVAFDIANNWCEYAADYHADPPHQLDYSLLPDKAHQARGCSTQKPHLGTVHKRCFGQHESALCLGPDFHTA